MIAREGEQLFRARKKLIVIGVVAELTALLLVSLSNIFDVYIRIAIASIVIIIGAGYIMVGCFYYVLIKKSSIEEGFLFYKRDIDIKKDAQIIEKVCYSNYEIGSVLLYFVSNGRTIKIRPRIIDTAPIKKALIDRDLLIIHKNPIVDCGSKCELPNIEIEVLSYRLIEGRKEIKKAFWILLILSTLSLFVDFEIGSWILWGVSTYWYYIIFEYHDLLFARGNLIAGNDDTVSSIWKKLDIKKDVKLIIKMIVITLYLWCIMTHFYFTTEVLIDNNQYAFYICLLVAFGMIRWCAIEHNIITWIIVTLIISTSVVVYSFFIEWNLSYYNLEKNVEVTIVDEKMTGTFMFEGEEYTLFNLCNMDSNSDRTDVIVHKSIFDNLYARVRRP